MKAMVLTAPRELAQDEVARPRLDARHVLVRVTHSGICGTDFKIYSGAIPVNYPRIMGHEMIGEVVEGGDAGGFRPGDRVIVDPELYCGSCFHCRIGQTHLCPKGMLLGRDANGGFAEYVAAPVSHVFHLPDSIDSRTAPLIQVLTTCLHAQRQINIFPAESVVVLGLGVTGQIHVQLAKARGASPYWHHTERRKAGPGAGMGPNLTIPEVRSHREVKEATTAGCDSSSRRWCVPHWRPPHNGALRRRSSFVIIRKEGALPFYDLTSGGALHGARGQSETIELHRPVERGLIHWTRRQQVLPSQSLKLPSRCWARTCAAHENNSGTSLVLGMGPHHALKTALA